MIGVDYPAYCLNADRDGTYEAGPYTVSIEDILDDSRLWRVITNRLSIQNSCSNADYQIT